MRTQGMEPPADDDLEELRQYIEAAARDVDTEALRARTASRALAGGDRALVFQGREVTRRLRTYCARRPAWAAAALCALVVIVSGALASYFASRPPLTGQLPPQAAGWWPPDREGLPGTSLGPMSAELDLLAPPADYPSPVLAHCADREAIVIAWDTCGNGVGQSRDASGDGDAGGRDRCQDAVEHIHDLGATVEDVDLIIAFASGTYSGCGDTLIVEVSLDGTRWRPVGRLATTSRDSCGSGECWEAEWATFLSIEAAHFVRLTMAACLLQGSAVFACQCARTATP